MADKDAERFEAQYFVDVEGKIPAKPGDAIALLVPGNAVPPESERLINTAGTGPILNTPADDLSDRL